MQTTTSPEQQTAPMTGKTQLSRFCFTINNWTQAELDWLQTFECKWIIVGKEIGANGTPHLQGACVLSTRRQFNTIKKMYGFARAHIEPMRGTIEDNIKYCTKEDTQAFTKGAIEQGRRNDIHSAIEKLRTAPSLMSLVQKDDDVAATFIKYPNGLTKYRNYLEPRRTTPPMVYWIYGDTGTGKTRSSVEWCERRGLEYWISLGGLQWFDGYDGETVAILDDFRTGHCKFSFLLRLLDRYKFQVPYKGGFRNWVPKIIFVTAPMPPREMFDLKKEGDIKQLERRITQLVPSPLTVEQLESITDASNSRETPPLVGHTEQTVLRREDRRHESLIIIDSDSKEESSDDESTEKQSSEDTDGLSEEEQKNMRPSLKRQNAEMDIEGGEDEERPIKFRKLD